MVSKGHIEEEIEALLKREHVPQEFVLFFKDLTQNQFEFKKQFDSNRLSIGISSQEMGRKLKEGVPLLDFTHITIEDESFEHLLLTLCDVLEKHGQGEADETVRLKKALEDNHLNVRELVRNVVEGDKNYFEQLSEELELESEFLRYLGTQTAKPYLELLAEKAMGGIGSGAWKKHICPICGHEPIMAKLEREEGRRILQCSLCNTEWAFRRLMCPFCLNDNQDTLRFFFVDEESPYRVDVCDSCKRYIKTVDERKMEEGQEVILTIENIATIFLDILAVEEGYQNPHQHFFGMKEEFPSSLT